MPNPRVINVKCPCCHEILEIDVQAQRVTAHRKGRHLSDDREGEEDPMEVALRQQREAKERAAKQFDSAHKGMATESERLDQLFKDAQRKVHEEGDEDEDDNPFGSGKIWD